MLSRFVNNSNMLPNIILIQLQKNHTGVNGRTGLSVARSVEVEYLTERGNAFHQNVHTLIPVTISVMEMIMKRRNAMNNVVQVCYIG